MRYYNLPSSPAMRANLDLGALLAHEGVQEPADVLVSPAFKEAELLGKSYK